MDKKTKERILADLETPSYATALKELLSYLRYLTSETIWVEGVFARVIRSLTEDGSAEALGELGKLTAEILREN